MTARPIRVLCVDDCPDTLLLLKLMLEEMPEVQHVGESTTTRTVAPLIREGRPDVLIVDLRIPGEDSLAFVRSVAREDGAPRIIVYSGFEDPDAVKASLDAGAQGFVTKASRPELLGQAVTSVMAGKTFVATR